MPEVVREALTAARAAGVTTAFDLNYRSKLWTTTEARRALEPLLELVDLFFIAEGNAQEILGVKETDPEAAARELARRYGIGLVSYIYNPPAGTGRLWDVVAVRGEEVVRPSRSFAIQTVDRLGAGDAFAGGFLYGYLRRDLQAAVEIGNAMLALKNTIPGDFALVTLAEVESLLAGEVGGVKR
jgi:2-dehydro-3-deoxygluconokinase